MPDEQFPVLDVSDWEIIADETAGAEEKYWLQERGTSRRWLFKSVTVKQGHVHGEDWAEKTAAQLAGLLGIPCACIELAELHGAPGCISADLRPPLHELQHGQVLLEERDAPGYVHGKGKVHPGHSVENIQAALQGMLPPPGYERRQCPNSADSSASSKYWNQPGSSCGMRRSHSRTASASARSHALASPSRASARASIV